MSSNRVGIPQSSTVNDTFGSLILKPGVGELKRPTWDGKDLWFRVLPGVDPDDQSPQPRLDPFRLEDGRFGQWFLPIRYANKVGNATDNRTYLLCDSLDATYDLNANPLKMMRKAIKDGIKNKVQGLGLHWAGLIKYDQNSKCEPIPDPKEGFLVAALILRRAGKDHVPPLGLEPHSPMQYLLLSKSTMNKMVDIFNERRKDYVANSPIDGFIHADPTSFTTGLFLSTFKPQGQQAQGVPAWGAPVQPQQQGAGGDDQYQSYDVQVLNLPALAQIQDLTPYCSHLVPKLKKFSDVVNVPDHDEQVRYICETLGKTDPDVVVYALGEQYKHVIPQSVMEAGHARLQMARGGYHPPTAVPNAGWGQPPQGYGQPPQGYGQPQPAYPNHPAGSQPAFQQMPPQQYQPQANQYQPQPQSFQQPVQAPAAAYAPATGWGQPQAAAPQQPAAPPVSWGQPQGSQPGYGQPIAQTPVNGTWGQPAQTPTQQPTYQQPQQQAPVAAPSWDAPVAQPPTPAVQPQDGTAPPQNWGASPPQAGAPIHVANPPELNGQLPAPGIAGSPIAPPGSTPITQADAMERMRALMAGQPVPPAAG